MLLVGGTTFSRAVASNSDPALAAPVLQTTPGVAKADLVFPGFGTTEVVPSRRMSSLPHIGYLNTLLRCRPGPELGTISRVDPLLYSLKAHGDHLADRVG